MTAAGAPYTYDPETMTVTCRACRQSDFSMLPEQAGPWYAAHQGKCSGTPGGIRPPAIVLQFPGTARSASTEGRRR
jgi:hypothetical protein